MEPPDGRRALVLVRALGTSQRRGVGTRRDAHAPPARQGRGGRAGRHGAHRPAQRGQRHGGARARLRGRPPAQGARAGAARIRGPAASGRARRAREGRFLLRRFQGHQRGRLGRRARGLPRARRADRGRRRQGPGFRAARARGEGARARGGADRARCAGDRRGARGHRCPARQRDLDAGSGRGLLCVRPQRRRRPAVARVREPRHVPQLRPPRRRVRRSGARHCRQGRALMLYNPARRASSLDPALLWSAVLLAALGLVMVYSASIAMAEAERFTGFRSGYFLARHSVYMAVGLAMAFALFRVPVWLWQRASPWLFLFGVLLLVALLIPGVGREVNGARRWLPLGFATFQPSEVMKLFVVLYASDYTVRKAAFMDDFKKGFLPMFGVMTLIAFLLLREPDFGALVVVTAVAMTVLFLGGLNWRLFAGLPALLAAAFVVLRVSPPHRLQKVLGFMDPWADSYGTGYQLSHSLIAFGRGEWLGVGLGASVEKLFYLPEAHTDFLLAVIAEELGFAGVLAVILLFLFLVHRAFAVGRQAASLERYYAALVAQGIGVWLAAQAFINMGVNMGLLPTKGLTLPLLSFGGTGIVVTCAAFGILLRVDWENRFLMRGGAK